MSQHRTNSHSKRASSSSSRASSTRPPNQNLEQSHKSNSLASLLSEKHKQQRNYREINHSGDYDQFKVHSIQNSQIDTTIGKWAEQVSAETSEGLVLSGRQSSRQSLPPFALESSGSQSRGTYNQNMENDRPRSSNSLRHRSKDRKAKSRSASLNLMNSIAAGPRMFSLINFV
jgi:hypothetical protein